MTSKGRLWREIQDYPGGKGSAQHRFSALKTRFAEERRKYLPSGSGIQEVSSWELFNEMQFLIPFLEDKKRESSLPDAQTVEIDEEDTGFATNESPIPPSKRYKISNSTVRESSDEKFHFGLGEMVKSAFGSGGEESEEHQFGRFVAASLIKLVDEDVKDEVMLVIQHALQKAKKNFRDKKAEKIKNPS